MAKSKQVKIQDMSENDLRSELGRVNSLINAKTIEWENANGEKRTCPFAVFNHTGKLLIGKDDDSVLWDAGTAVQIRCEAERRNGGTLATVKASHQVKAGTCSATVRTSGMRADVSTVTVQLAEAQKLAGRARAISAELFARAEAQAEREAIAAEQAKAAKVGDLVKTAFNGGSITAEEAELLNVELSAEVA